MEIVATHHVVNSMNVKRMPQDFIDAIKNRTDLALIRI